MFQLKNNPTGLPEIHNHELTPLINRPMSVIYPSQAIIYLINLTSIYPSTHVFIYHLLIYLRLSAREKIIHMITK